ncbi:MAG TPA: FAD-binding oxidoreductase [Streptosporangiaceae bacterium]|jgi:FAD/FMN-containing dehydrogenase
MTTGSVLSDAITQELRDTILGDVIMPGDEEYEQARSVWNGLIDRHPAVVVRCAGAADVLAAVRFARDRDVKVAVRGGGHNVAGFGTCDDGMVIDLSPMKGIWVDPAARTVHAQGGVLWGELDHETQALGLATTGGVVSTTGIGGFTLGGGIGWLMRQHGLAADNLISADVVTADGRLITASERENPDLLWGLRGGGGNFGIVTSMELALHEVGPVVYAGAALYPREMAGELLKFYAGWTARQPDELTTVAVFLTAPPEPFIPAELRGKPAIGIAACYCGPLAGGEAAIAPLREFAEPAADVIGPVPYTMMQQFFDPSAPRGIRSYWKSAYLDELSPEAIGALVSSGQGMDGLFPLAAMHVHHMEGATRRQPAGGSAFAHRDPKFVVNILGMWPEPGGDDPHIRWVRDSHDALAPYSTGDPYLNFLAGEGSDQVRAAYGEEAYARLAALKASFDPGNMFRLNQNIPPAR